MSKHTERHDVTVTPQTGHVAVRQPVTLRLRDGQRDLVHAKARVEGKSLNEMVCDLLDRGLAYDRHQADIFGSIPGFAVARVLMTAAEAAVVKYGADQGLWMYDIENFDRAADAIRRMLEVLRPAPETQEALAQVEEARKQHLRLVKGGSNG
jgi:hypothetical protein